MTEHFNIADFVKLIWFGMCGFHAYNRTVLNYQSWAFAFFAPCIVVASCAQQPSDTFLKLPVIQVQAYGAMPDGAMDSYRGSDSTSQINAAITDACRIGGARIKLKPGVYNISMPAGVPPRTSAGALTIPCNNIAIVGSGSSKTILSFWLTEKGRHVPVTSICPRNPDVSSSPIPRVWRGSAIYITGGSTAAEPRSGVTIADLRITGNAQINGDNTNPITWTDKEPLNTSKCNAWDTSNKGIYLQNDTFERGPEGIDQGGYYPPVASYFNQISILRVRVDHFLGELVYEGNRGLTASRIVDSEFDHTNGDCVSVGGEWTFSSNFCHDAAANGFEDSPDGFSQVYLSNRLANIRLDGISLTNLDYGPNNRKSSPSSIIRENSFTGVQRHGISLWSEKNVVIEKNSIADSPTGILLYDYGIAKPLQITKPVTNGVTGLSNPALQGTLNDWSQLPRPTSPPKVSVSGRGAFANDTYTFAIAWTFQYASQVVVGSMGPQVKLTPTTQDAEIRVTLGETPPARATGYAVFVGKSSSPLTLQSTEDLALDMRPKTFRSYKATAITGASTPMIFAPNLSNIVVRDNKIYGGNNSKIVGIQCCGEPRWSPMASAITIQGNTLFINQLNPKADYRVVNYPGRKADPASELTTSEPSLLYNRFVLERNQLIGTPLASDK